jgi:hypothetical protein
MEIGSTQIIFLLIAGIGVGFASGLLGIGGCFIMVPVQFWALTSIGVDPTIAIRTAFGTNLAVVLPTAISGAIGHSRKKAVSWKAGIILGLSGLAGSFVGGYSAAHISGNILKIGFGLAILAGGIRMLTAKPPKVEKEPIDNVLLYILWGFPLGIVSGIIGIGGGVLMVPVMVLAMRFKMHQAVGTSTALMIFTSIGGILSYIVNGLNVSGLPPYSLGYVNFLQWILLAGTSVPMAQVGVRAVHKLPAKQLKYLFIAAMIYMGLKMIGVFAWLHLPI